MSHGTDGSSPPANASTAFERIGGSAVLLILAALSGGSGLNVFLTGKLIEGGSRGAPRQLHVLQGVAAYTGGAFLISVGATLLLLALSGLRFRRVLFGLLVVNFVAFFAAVAGRFVAL